MYWSDCSGPATIQTARIEDGGDQQILINDTEHSCIVGIAIDYHSRCTRIILRLYAKIRHNFSTYRPVYIRVSISRITGR